MSSEIIFKLNGAAVTIAVAPTERLASVLRETLRLTGTKIGCDAGDCGACTVLIDGRQHCACLVAAAQIEGRSVTTVEGLASPDGTLALLQQAFHAGDAVQCGICTPAMLMAASDLLTRCADPTRTEIEDALGGVLCRCTGYQPIVESVLAAVVARRDGSSMIAAKPRGDAVVGQAVPKVDGVAKLTGAERYGADDVPDDALALRVIRSPHAAARFRLGDMAALQARHPGLVRVFTARDVPGINRFGIYPTGKDQPVLAEHEALYRGDAICALVGDAATLLAIRDDDVPIVWDALEPLRDAREALRPGARRMHAHLQDNILVAGRLRRGDVDAAFTAASVKISGAFATSFVEHAYVEPEAGWARRVGDRLEIFATTQSPYMDRDEVAHVMGLAPEQIRIMPSACGGGFGGKLDLSVQPLLAMAAWHLGRAVRCVYSRPESMMATTKRHPAEIHATLAADRAGNFLGYRFRGDYDTGAYASWGPTVAGRVPVHASGPYRIPNLDCVARAIHSNAPPSGAFRGFGVPQATIAGEALIDELAARLGVDALEIRLRNALRRGDTTGSGQVLGGGVGLVACLEQLREPWRQLRAASESFNATTSARKRGVGMATLWYGIGNTGMSNPAEIEIGITRAGRVMLFSGAVDIGQGSNTILAQIAADALGVALAQIELVVGDTDRTRDAGKTSASRQTYVSGNATKIAAENLRARILRLGNAGADATIGIEGKHLRVGGTRVVDLASLPDDEKGCVLFARGRFDPIATGLDADGQGSPYGAYAFGAQLAQVEIDIALGTTKVLRIVAAHDVGRAINPAQVRGQITGGVAQGIGLALMEEYVPGRTENLHDYLIPTFGDVPPIDVILVESDEPSGPYGAKGVGEPALIGVAPAIFNAIYHATGTRVRRAPATPDRLFTALREKAKSS